MTPLGTAATALLFLFAALGGVLFGIALAWREVQREAAGLPVWRFLRRPGAAPAFLDGPRVRNAEIRCVLCGFQRQCRRRLAAGEPAPDECPNRALLPADTRRP